MSIVIREVCGNNGLLGLSLVENNNIQESVYDQSPEPVAHDSIMVDIEGIHEVVTRNFNRYIAEGLRKSIPSWTKPYQKPMIMHHNERDGKIIGRIKSVELKEHKTRSGTPALLFTSNISDKEGKEQVRDGRLSTVSIGIIAHDVRCSICGHNIAMQGECEEHEKGQVYGGERCYWDIHEFEGKELSYVIVPSDVYASNIRIYEPKEQKLKVTEQQQLPTSEVLAVNEENKLQESAELKEDKVLDEKVSVEPTEKEEPKAAADDTAVEKEAESEENDKKKEAADKLEDVIAELEQVKKDLSESQSELAEEKSLRESLEEQLEKHKMAVKESLAVEILSLRESAGRKPLDREVLLSRSEESLKDAIIDLKEELAEAGDSAVDITEAADKIENPGLSTEKGSVDVEEQKKSSNTVEEVLNLQESLNSLFD